MFFEIQLTSDSFCRIVRNATKWLDLGKMEAVKKGAFHTIDMCRINGRSGDTDADGNWHDLINPHTRQPCIIDHVDILDGTSIRSERTGPLPSKSHAFRLFGPGMAPNDVTVPYLQIVQPINIQTTTAGDLQSAGPNPAAYDAFRVEIVLDVWLDVAAFLHCAFHEIYNSLIPPAQKTTIEAMLRKMIAIPAIPLDLTQIASAMNKAGGFGIVNAGIACMDGADFVSVRIDFDISASGPDVTEVFFTDGPSERILGGNDWALLIDQNFICVEANSRFVAGIANHPSKIKLDGDGEVWWSGDAVNPYVELRYPVEVTKKNLPWISCTAIVRGAITCSPGPLDTLIYTYYLNAKPRGGVAFVIDYVLPILGPPLWGAIADSVDMTKDIPPISDKMTCGALSNAIYQCVLELMVPMRFPPGYMVRFGIDNLSGLTRGLVIGGKVLGLNDIPAGHVALTVTPFRWTVEGSCGTGFSIVDKARIEVGDGSRICNAIFLENPLDEFRAVIRIDEDIVHPDVKRNDNAIDIYARGTPEYAIDPQPCRVRVITNAGVRTISFDPPDAMTDDQRHQLETFKQSSIKLCQDWELAHSLPDTNVVPPGPSDGPDWTVNLVTVLVVAAAVALAWMSIGLHDQIAGLAGETMARIAPWVAVPAALAVAGARLLVQFAPNRSGPRG